MKTHSTGAPLLPLSRQALTPGSKGTWYWTWTEPVERAPAAWVAAPVPAHPRLLSVQVLPVAAVQRISSLSIMRIMPGSTVAAVTEPVTLGATVKLRWVGELMEVASVPKGNWQS